MILREQREQRCSGWIGTDTWRTSDAQFTDYSECFFYFPKVDQFSMTPHWDSFQIKAESLFVCQEFLATLFLQLLFYNFFQAACL